MPITAFQVPTVFRILTSLWLSIEAATCRPSGRMRGKKPPPGKCNGEDDSECCKRASFTPHSTILTLNNFEKGGDGGGPSECDNKFHSDNTPVVALSTGWFNNKKRCHHNITIFANGRRVNAMVVDECDSTIGCDADHDFQPPCPNNVVDASKAVWKALGVPKRDWGELDIHWSDA
ncbi:putative ripening-related protein 2 [Spatholobus suberectus]|nr:putative ripening-related protein 2 [Spatholobus suberectus]